MTGICVEDSNTQPLFFVHSNHCITAHLLPLLPLSPFPSPPPPSPRYSRTRFTLESSYHNPSTRAVTVNLLSACSKTCRQTGNKHNMIQKSSAVHPTGWSMSVSPQKCRSWSIVLMPKTTLFEWPGLVYLVLSDIIRWNLSLVPWNVIFNFLLMIMVKRGMSYKGLRCSSANTTLGS